MKVPWLLGASRNPLAMHDGLRIGVNHGSQVVSDNPPPGFTGLIESVQIFNYERPLPQVPSVKTGLEVAFNGRVLLRDVLGGQARTEEEQQQEL